jgi:hypothetical protein
MCFIFIYHSMGLVFSMYIYSAYFLLLYVGNIMRIKNFTYTRFHLIDICVLDIDPYELICSAKL